MMTDEFWFAIGRIAGLLLAIVVVCLVAGWVHSIIWLDPDKETA